MPVSSLHQYLFLALAVTSMQFPIQISGASIPDTFELIPDVCPSLLEVIHNSSSLMSKEGNATDTNCAVKDDEIDDTKVCTTDRQCQIGSKCCPVDHCGNLRCVDLLHGSLSDPKPHKLSTRTQRQRRQFDGCVSCACIRNCRTNRQCLRRYGRARRHCYINSCSSYCIP